MPLELTRARLSDGELLESYCNRSDQQAFATLVDRYAPYAGDRKWMWRWPDFSPVHRSLGGLSKLSQAALCVLTGLVCAGAGTAAVTGYDVITTRLANAAPGDGGGNAATATRKVVPSPSEEDSNQGSSYAGYHYGAATAVPEPGSLVLIVGAGAALLGRRTSMLRRAYEQPRPGGPGSICERRDSPFDPRPFEGIFRHFESQDR